MARLGGDVHIIHGPNELTGNDALVNMRKPASPRCSPLLDTRWRGPFCKFSQFRPRRGSGPGVEMSALRVIEGQGGLVATGLGKHYKKRPWCATSRSR